MANVSISEEDLFKFVQLMHSEEPLLYFIQSGDSGPIKIGVSKNIASRLNQLQTGHPEKLTVIGICKGGYFEEKRLHSVFAAFRRKGEWFTPHKKILEYVWDNSLIRSESVNVQLRDVKGGRPKQKRDDSNPIAEEIPKHLSTTKHDSSGSTAADSDFTIDIQELNAMGPFHKCFAEACINLGKCSLNPGQSVDDIVYSDDDLAVLKSVEGLFSSDAPGDVRMVLSALLKAESASLRKLWGPITK